MRDLQGRFPFIFACEQAVNHIHIPFAKHTMWKKAIIKGTLDSCREVHEDLVSFLLTSIPIKPRAACYYTLAGPVPALSALASVALDSVNGSSQGKPSNFSLVLSGSSSAALAAKSHVCAVPTL